VEAGYGIGNRMLPDRHAQEVNQTERLHQLVQDDEDAQMQRQIEAMEAENKAMLNAIVTSSGISQVEFDQALEATEALEHRLTEAQAERTLLQSEAVRLESHSVGTVGQRRRRKQEVNGRLEEIEGELSALQQQLRHAYM